MTIEPPARPDTAATQARARQDASHATPAWAPKTAMVFAAGLGTRMRPLTLTKPKPMIEVAGRPLIDHMLDRLVEAGVARAVVNVHWLADQIADHVKRRADIEVIVSDERDRLLDQGGGIMKAMPHLGDGPILVCNTDAVWIPSGGWSLRRLFEAWDPARMDVALVVAAGANAIGVDWEGDFLMDPQGRLTRRPERVVAPFVYAGVGLIDRKAFEGETREVFRLAPVFFDAAARGRLFGLRLDGQWLHVGAPEAVAEADDAFARSLL